jgi:excisionase family DNA binding protein
MLPILTPVQLAELLAVPVDTLKKWRYQRRGPDFITTGGLVRYRREAVEHWLTELTVETARQGA